MRFLLTPVGSAGDTLPFVGLGRELARRGHEVTVAASEHFETLVGRCGLAFVSTSSEDEYRLAIDDANLFDARRGYAAVMERVAEYNRRLFDTVSAARAQGPLAVVAHSLDFASRVIADATGLRVVRMHLQPAVIRSVHDVPVMRGTTDFSFLPAWLKRGLWRAVDHAVLDPPIAPAVNAMRRRMGLAPLRRVFVHQIDSPLLTLAMFPAWYAPPQPDWPPFVEQCDFPLFDAPDADGLPADVERFLDSGTPPIVFTAGSAMRYGHRFFAAAVGVCERLGRRGLLLTPHAGQVPAALPDGLARFDFAPLGAVLPRTAALVHHGGIGTTAAGLAAGVPQLIVPFSHDQPDNAARVRRLGAGEAVEARSLVDSRAAAVLERLIGSEATRHRCGELARRCASRGGLTQACDRIESAVSVAPPAY